MKRIEINPAALKSQQDDPIAKLPVAEPPKNPSQFNLDPNLVEKALQAPQPSLATPSVPEPNKVIAATDLTQGMPTVESDTSKITAEVAADRTGGERRTDHFFETWPSRLINANNGTTGTTAGGAPATGNGAGSLPGFATLAPGFKAPDPNLSHLPEPVLLRLPSDVLFDFDSATLKPDADALLGQAVAMITKYPQADIHIDGYSDSFGKTDYNTTLSDQRATGGAGLVAATHRAGHLQFSLTRPRQYQLRRQHPGQHRTAAAQPPRRNPHPSDEAVTVGTITELPN